VFQRAFFSRQAFLCAGFGHTFWGATIRDDASIKEIMVAAIGRRTYVLAKRKRRKNTDHIEINEAGVNRLAVCLRKKGHAICCLPIGADFVFISTFKQC
jgi:hypothetical protein